MSRDLAGKRLELLKETFPRAARIAVLYSPAEPSTLPELRETYEFQVDDEIFHLTVAGGAVLVERGPAAGAVLRIHTDATTFIRIGAGALGPFEALATGMLSMSGERDAIVRCASILGLRDRSGSPETR